MSDLSLEVHPTNFFDGVCGMCNSSVDMIVRVDKKAVFRFATIQGGNAKEFFPPFEEDPAEWTAIYQDEHGLHDQSDGPLLICKRIGGIGVASLCPPLHPQPGVSTERAQSPPLLRKRGCLPPPHRSRARPLFPLIFPRIGPRTPLHYWLLKTHFD